MKAIGHVFFIICITLGEECASEGGHLVQLDQISNRTLCKDISGSFYSDGTSNWPKENFHRTLLNTIKYTLPKNQTGIDWRLLDKSESFTLKIQNNVLELHFPNERNVKINLGAVCASGEWRTEMRFENRVEGGHANSYVVNDFSIDENGNLIVKSFNSSVTKSFPPFSYKHNGAAVTKFARVE
jgi:hypothetical protein